MYCNVFFLQGDISRKNLSMCYFNPAPVYVFLYKWVEEFHSEGL